MWDSAIPIKSTLTSQGQEQDATIHQLKAAIAQQEKDFRAIASSHEREIETLTVAVKEQAAQLQKMSEQLGRTKAAARVVAND